MSQMKHATARSEKSELATQFSQRLREGFVLLTLAIGFFLLIALYTYEKTDPGWSSSGITKEIANSGGRAGAWIADLLLNFFGYLSYVFPILVGFCAWLFYKENVSDRERNYRLVSLKLFGFILILVACTGFASLHLPHFYTHVPLSAGGIIGDLVSRGLTHFFNVTGTTLILLLLFLGGVTWSSGLSWFRIFSFAFNYLGSWSKRLLPKWDKPFLKIKIMLGQLVARKSHPKASLKSLEEFVEIIPQPQKAKISKPSNSRRVEPTVSMEIADFKTTSIKPEIFTTDFADPEIFTMDEAFSVKKEPARRVSKEIAKVKPRLTSSSSQSQGVPALTLLQASYGKGKTSGFSEMDLLAKSQDVEQRLQDFGVDARVVAVHPGPVITRFELQLAPGLKVSKISALAKDLARSLSVISVRIVDVIPGKTVVGLELPNEQRAIVGLREVLESSQYQDAVSPLSLALGKDIAGHPVVVDLAKMPHLLVAGTTGSGKSVGVNSMLMSILYKATPEQVRLILVDPKMLELSIYDGIPHLLTPVVTDMKDAASALRWCVAEMERRYRLMAFMGVRNLAGFNQKITEAEQRGEPIPDPFTNPTGTNDTVLKVLPFIVVIIDEFADMMMVVGKKVEQLIARIAQKARAAGIHMILATQRPSVDVITGLIKANIPTRIAFQVSSKIDSRTILDQQGAEQLLGHGDMLYLPPGSGVPTRVHGAFISDEDVHNVVNVLKQQGEPEYLVEVLTISTDSEVGIGGEEGSSDGEADPLYDQAVEFVLSTRKASISSLQRRLKIGYNRAARMIETMEHAGVVGPMENSGGREILVERVEEH